ncbi:MAG: hypothetical protein A2010_03240 [Nitrospirae bacterium GWD2_57_9]|nr:MAG: hypothetical protein A2010_03240 [Nitrospirae bacterium GWD2_57_9]OGW48621.1 MAG: hypothetical protein A2078_08805 [Nitrospirae bacterium GWC2_57_9]
MATIKKKGYASQKHPEQEIVSLARTVSDWVSENNKIFTIAVSVLAAVLVLVGGYSLKRSLDEQKAGVLLAAAYEAYSPTAASTPDHTRAVELFRNVTKKYPSSLSGAIARYYAANSLMNLGRTEEALSEYEYFTTHYKDPFLLGLVYQRMGYLYSAFGKQAEAIKSFERADALIGPGMATMELARLYESSGNSGEAEKKYRVIADKLQGTAWAVEAQGKVRKIEPLPGPAAGTGEPKESASGKNK